MTYPGQRSKNPPISLFFSLEKCSIDRRPKDRYRYLLDCPNENKNGVKQVKNNRKKKQKTKKQSNKQKLNRTTAAETITNKTKLICSFFHAVLFS